MILAAIDVGSNSIKLVIAQSNSSAESFTVLRREKEVVRLGHGTLTARHLAPAAISRAAASIERFCQVAKEYKADRIVAIATASVREADNAAEFIDEVERHTGVRVAVLSGIEEARLIGLAVWNAEPFRGKTDSLINIDIGGGSTELSLMQHGEPAALFSIKMGAVGFTERFISSDPVKAKELRQLRREIDAALERPSRELGGHNMRWAVATGTSGTILAIGESLYSATAGRNRRARGGSSSSSGGSLAHAGSQPPSAQSMEIAIDQLERFNAKMATLSAAERRAFPGISNQRADIIIAGGQILEGTMRALRLDRLQPCDWALREGVIIDCLREFEAESQPIAPHEAARPHLLGAKTIGLRFSYEEAHAEQVARLAEQIFDSLAPVYRLSRHQRTLLSAAALLHDIGYVIAHESHHKHSLYLIKHSELTGFTEAERLVIANVARYHRRALPKERHPDYALLAERDRETVWRLGAILRIADSLDRSHRSRVRDVRCVFKEGAMTIYLSSAEACDEEMWAAEQKRDMFEQTFGLQLAFARRAREAPAEPTGGTGTTEDLAEI